MKTLKALAFWFSFLMLTPLLASCDDDDNGGSDKDRDNDNEYYEDKSGIIGTWQGDDESITFTENGTYIWKQGWETTTGKFTYENNGILILTYESFGESDRTVYYAEISDETLILTNTEYKEDYHEFYRENNNYPTLSQLIGTWAYYYTNGVVTVTFRADGTGKEIAEYIDGKHYEGTFEYTYNETTGLLRQTDEEGTGEYTLTLEGNRLKMTKPYSGDTYIYVRQ